MTERHATDPSIVAPKDPLSGIVFMNSRELPGLFDAATRNAQSHSVWPLTFGLACCAIEMMTAASSRYDLDRFGSIFRASPRQADLLIVSGTVTFKMAPRIERLYEQMPEPKWVISMGSCANCGGPYWQNGYHVVKGVDTLIPVDVFVLGCPPRPESLLDGLMLLQKRIRAGVPHGQAPETAGPIQSSWREQSLELVYPKKIDPRVTAKGRVSTRGLEEGSTQPVNWGRDAFEVHRLLTDRFGPSAARIQEEHLDHYLVVDANLLPEAVEHMQGAGASRMDMLANLCGVDLGIACEDRFSVVYHLESSQTGKRVVLKVQLPSESPQVPTLAHIFPAANWNEREVYDMFGIVFTGHPDWDPGHPHRMRILCREDWIGFPLRKDYEWAKEYDGVPTRRAAEDPRKGVWVNLGETEKKAQEPSP